MKLKFILFLSFMPFLTFAQKAPRPVPPITQGENGILVYKEDDKGNRVPDFSYCGYNNSESEIPVVKAKVIVPLQKGDATASIQGAIDFVSTLPLDANGFRGAVLLEKGVYEVYGSLKIRHSGIVLRGSGMHEGETVILGKGLDRETLLTFKGVDDKIFSKPVEIINEYLPVNSTVLSVKNGNFKAGDKIIIRRPGTAKWIEALGTAHFGGGITAIGWKPGNYDIFWERTIKSVKGNDIIIDIPVTNQLDKEFGASEVSGLTWNGRISNCGIENLCLESDWDRTNNKDENHRWIAISLENIQNSWVRRITFRHFASSAVYALSTSKQITVEDCKALEPISEIGGFRRNTFYNEGQLNLFQRIYSEYGFHDFSTGFCTAGPNAFVQCHSYLPYSFSGAKDSWATGLLFDLVEVDGNALSYKFRGQDGQGAGWTAANSVFWKCIAAVIECPKPPTAQNWAFGSWSQFQGDGSWWSSNEHISPMSLYYRQLENRLGNKALDGKIKQVVGNSTSAPSHEVAREMTKLALKPALQLKDWIDSVVLMNPIVSDDAQAKIFKYKSAEIKKSSDTKSLMQVSNGWLVYNGKPVLGMRQRVEWWRGDLKPNFNRGTREHLTRFAPGKTGRGFTDDINEVVNSLTSRNVVALDHNYGLWYDRRRDDHERVRRMDGNVWAPFYEQPFARSGQGLAFDGLSKYDLTKWNYWYWNRLKTYADLADQKGLILFHHNFFQHNIIEAGAHWTDSPWRTANNVNNPGFPEPVNYAGDDINYMAEQFYDVNHPVRRVLLRNYIRKCLENFADNNSVIQFIGFEYTGPLHFTEFWLDVIAEWEKETGKNVLVALGVTKDVQDKILQDKVRSAAVDIIDTKAWNYLPGGKMFAPGGGLNIAPRQHMRLKGKVDMQTGNPPSERASKAITNDDLVYWAIRDYKELYPEKAVIYSSETAYVGWAGFMAGGSVCNLPTSLPEAFLYSATKMKPLDLEGVGNNRVLGKAGEGYIIYINAETQLKPGTDLLNAGYKAQWIDAESGKLLGKVFKLNAKSGSVINAEGKDKILWIYR